MKTPPPTIRLPILLALIFSCYLLGVAHVSLAKKKVVQPKAYNPIKMWTRVDGDHTRLYRLKKQKKRLQAPAISQKMLKKIDVFDIQYKQKRRYLAISLPTLIKRYPVGKRIDLALLHFANKMLVPYPLALMKHEKRFPIHIALATWSKQKKSWVRTFPTTQSTQSKRFADLRSARFTTNKMVVQSPWNPTYALRPSRQLMAGKGVHPWKGVDTLVGIEFVESRQYYRQFNATKTRQERKGLQLFKQICQFCHGVRKIGSAYGWDFVKPQPIYQRKSGLALYFHMRHQAKKDQGGTAMPAIKGMTFRDSYALWYWLRSVSKRRTLPYRSSTPKAPKKRR